MALNYIVNQVALPGGFFLLALVLGLGIGFVIAILLYLSARVLGVEKASFIRALLVGVIGVPLFLLVIASEWHSPIGVSLQRPQLIILFFVFWIIIIKLGFDASVAEAFSIAVFSVVIFAILLFFLLTVSGILIRMLIPYGFLLSLIS